eukprot:CCRYP_016132-RC/>CCRYP_016132-RC protein AED:0.28 eAED:0.28 QI:348/1/1/1/1/1/11/531/685
MASNIPLLFSRSSKSHSCRFLRRVATPLSRFSTTTAKSSSHNQYLDFSTLHSLNVNAVQAYASNPLFGTFRRDKFEWMTYEEFGKRVHLCRALLKDVGVTTHSKVGIISNNRHEWATIAAATYSLNATLVPMYEAQLPKDWTHILNDSQCQTLVASTEDIYLRIKSEVLPSTPLINEVICLDSPKDEPNSFEGMMENMAGRELCKVIEPSEEDLANLIYTSGTTGKPKGVELIHSNQVSNIKAGREMVVDPADFIQARDRSLAFLPWAHSYGQTCELWCLISQGASMGICRGVPHILDDLQLVQPTLLFAVPTLYKRVHDGVINVMNNATFIQRMLMQSALRLGKAHAAHVNDGKMPSLGFVDGLKHKLLDEIVLSKIRARFGGNLRAGFVAGAACPKEIIEFTDAVGIPICEGYGLTETSPVIAMSVLGRRKAGAVGKVLNGVTVHILDSEGNPLPVGEEGEICCSGPNVMKGYHNNHDATTEVITIAPDGRSRLFHTGDLGKMDSNGFLAVTGRIKEQYKLENGKYVCPTPIEQAIGMSRFISQVVVCGANRPYNVALVVPDWLAVRSELGISTMNTSEEDLVNDCRVKGLINAEIKLNCYKIKKFEIPKAWACVAPFTAANNMVTPKMSIRRRKFTCVERRIVGLASLLCITCTLVILFDCFAQMLLSRHTKTSLMGCMRGM